MRLSIIFLIGLFAFCSTSYSQSRFTVSQVYFAGEPVTSVDASADEVWVIKGNDSLGLSKVDVTGNAIDYSAQMKSLNIQPLAYLLGSYRQEAFIASKQKIFKFKEGVVSALDTALAGIYGSPILGMEREAGKTRILTGGNIFTSYDNNQFGSFPLFNGEFKNPIKLAGTAFLHIGAGRCINASEALLTDFSTPSTYYRADLPYDPTATIYDFVIGGIESFYNLFLASNKELYIQDSRCNKIGSFFINDGGAFCLQKFEDQMLIGTATGLYSCAASYPKSVEPIDLGIGEVKVYAMALEAEKGILWLGTNKGLVKVNFNNATANLLLKANWATKIGGKGTDVCTGVATDHEGNVLITGTFNEQCSFDENTKLSAFNSSDYFIAKYTGQGKLKWVKTAESIGIPGFQITESGLAVAADAEGNVIISGYVNSYAPDREDSTSISFDSKQQRIKPNQEFLVKYSSEGNVLWTKYFSGINWQNTVVIKTDKNGNIYLLHHQRIPSQVSTDGVMAIHKMDKDGNILWNRDFPGATCMDVSEDGTILLAGNFNHTVAFENTLLSSGKQYSSYVLYINGDGQILTAKYITGDINGDNGAIFHIGHDASKNVYLSGIRNGKILIDNRMVSPNSQAQNNFILKLTHQGTLVWSRRFGLKGYLANMRTDSLGFSVGNFIYNGDFTYENATLQNQEISYGECYVKIDPSGNLYSVAPVTYNDSYASSFVNHLVFGKDQNIIGIKHTEKHVSIFDNKLLNSGGTDILVYNLQDSLNISNLNTVSGKVFNDKNKNNKFDAGDSGLPGIILKAEPGEMYSQSDSAGNYIFYLKKGGYTLSQIIPEHKGILMSQRFPANKASYSIQLSGTKKDTAGFDFADDAVLSPYLSVDVSSIRRRRCFRGTTNVQYCNEGFLNAENVSVKLELPEYVIPISSDKAWTSINGKTLTFNIGTVTPGHCGNIVIEDSVQCGDESILGLTQCVKAHITPSNKVIPIPAGYDRSDLSLKATCNDNGYIALTLTNTATGMMSDSTQFRIFLDTTIVYIKMVKLLSGDSLALHIPANGRSLRAEADQTKHHPSGQPATLTLEGCKSVQQTVVSKGFTNQFPPNDEEAEEEISCTQIVGSMDPNDKQVVPSGITDHHYIEENAELEYLLRFMNKGTDTAFTVVISDTLSALLDISTFRPGVTSHPCRWKISGASRPVLTCTFSNILLPDSITDEKGSHGFAKFTIRHKENSKGLKIRNKAYIYFDYNSAVITNEAFVTIGLSPLPLKQEVMQHCKNQRVLRSDTSYVRLCGTDEAIVQVGKNDSTYAVWHLPASGPVITQATESTTTITRILPGRNTFVLQNQYCNAAWSNTVLVERYEKPEASPDLNLYYCEGTARNSLSVSGTNITWYQNSDLTKKIGKGSNFTPPYEFSGKVYTTQTINGCEGKPSAVNISYRQRPAPPITTSYNYCTREHKKFVDANGQSITWYFDSTAHAKVGLGSRLIYNQISSGDSLTFYATQQVNGCESAAAPAFIKVKRFDLKEVRIPNVISKSQTDLFHLPHFATNECVGNFENVTVFDVTGKQVFYSEDELFEWTPLAASESIFLYRIRFSDQMYKGKLLVKD